MSIQIELLTEADKGRRVCYRPEHFNPAAGELGVISSWNNAFVFVRYGSSTRAAATDPKDLEWELGREGASFVDQQ